MLVVGFIMNPVLLANFDLFQTKLINIIIDFEVSTKPLVSLSYCDKLLPHRASDQGMGLGCGQHATGRAGSPDLPQ